MPHENEIKKLTAYVSKRYSENGGPVRITMDEFKKVSGIKDNSSLYRRIVDMCKTGKVQKIVSSKKAGAQYVYIEDGFEQSIPITMNTATPDDILMEIESLGQHIKTIKFHLNKVEGLYNMLRNERKIVIPEEDTSFNMKFIPDWIRNKFKLYPASNQGE